MTRRMFIGVFLSAGALCLSRFVHARVERLSPNETNDFVAKLRGYFRHQKSARVVGRAYLQAVPDEANVRRLVDLISAVQPERRSEFARSGKKQLHKLLNFQQRSDFSQGRVVKVRGWILSETEARLYALTALAE